ncbi:MAG: ABC transporter ATP-binding protein [Wujia sp.]
MIEVKNITKKYGNADSEICAVNNASIKINEGEFCVIIGKSGSGKTTFLNIIGGLLKPDSGVVLFNDEDIYSMSDKRLSSLRRNDISFIFQSYNLIPDMAAEANILLPAKLDHRKIDRQYFEEIVEELGISNRLTHNPTELSGGEQQRVAIARALMNHPKVILCDEPTGNLDEEATSDVMRLLKSVNKKHHTTIIMVTHDLLIAENAERVIKIRDGVVEE